MIQPIQHKSVFWLDNEGEPLSVGVIAISSQDQSVVAVELTTGIDLNNDGTSGFVIAQ